VEETGDLLPDLTTVAQQILGNNVMLLSRRHGASFLPPVSHFSRLL
jgi:hypothetical protein